MSCGIGSRVLRAGPSGKRKKVNSSVEVSTTAEAIRDFYQLHRRTRRRHGLAAAAVSILSEYL